MELRLKKFRDLLLAGRSRSSRILSGVERALYDLKNSGTVRLGRDLKGTVRELWCCIFL